MDKIDLDLAIAPDGSVIAIVLKRPEGQRITFDDFLLELEVYLHDATEARKQQITASLAVQ